MADYQPPQSNIVPIITGEPVSTAVGTVIATIGGILTSIFGGGGGSTKQLTETVQHIETQVLTGLKTIGLALQLAFGAGIIGFLRRLWGALGQLAQRVHDALDRISKIIAYIRRIHDYLFNRFIAPVLNAIQHIRQLLVIFRLFHLKFATKLDATLAGIEYKIAANFQLAWSKINELISWAQILTTPTGLFNPAVLWGSILRDIQILRGLTGLGPASPLLAADQAGQALDRGLFSHGAVTARQAVWSSGQMPDVFKSRLAVIRAKTAEISKGV